MKGLREGPENDLRVTGVCETCDRQFVRKAPVRPSRTGSSVCRSGGVEATRTGRVPPTHSQGLRVL